ncbi:MAG: SAV_2336 N-terminal domain-related protein [Blastocatellia bacterium]
MESPLAQFIAELQSERLDPDYRDLADLLWLERLAATEDGRGELADSADEERIAIAEPIDPSKRPEARPLEKRRVGAAPLYSPVARAVEAERIPDMRVRLAAVTALPDAADLRRALKPFARRVKSRRLELLDEEATANASAEAGYLHPVRRGAPERWFSVALVVEDWLSMAVWRQTAEELRDLLRQHGAFHEVRQWGLAFDADGPYLTLPGGRRPVEAARRAVGHQLILLLTDGASARWSEAAMARTLETWSRDCSVVIIQALSRRLWPRTPLGWPETEVQAEMPGSSNRALRFPIRSWEWTDGAPTAVPIVSLDADLIGQWAGMLLHPGKVCHAALFSPRAHETEERLPPPPPREEPSAGTRVANFRSLVSPETRRLAVYLSLLPVTLPLMRIVQMTLIRRPRQEQLAELLLGGILRRVTPIAADLPDDEIEYDFHDGVREILEKGVYVEELDAMLTALGDYIGDHPAGKFDMSALLPHKDGDDSLPALARPIAKFLIPALRRLGLEYLIGGDFIIREVDDSSLDPDVQFHEFTFETITLDERGAELERPSLSARQFTEPLAENVHLEMVEIPGGKFLMGSPKTEKDSYDDERPQHEVTVASFYMGKYAVTQAQWHVIASDASLKIERDLDPDPSRFGDDRPVESVSWEDAKEYCARLTKKTGQEYRLPSEAEWEYACRAGTTTPFAFGATVTHETVNYNSEYPYAKAEKKKSRGETIPAGSLGLANAFGLFDMHGNVWEWCEDLWHGNYEDAPTDGSAWLSGGDSRNRVLRGGSWADRSDLCRSAYRGHYEPDARDNDDGFRVVVGARDP